MWKKVTAVATLVVVLFALVACGGGGLVGRWQNEWDDSEIIVFNRNGTGTVEYEWRGEVERESFRWNSSNGTLTVVSEDGHEDSTRYTISADGNTLRLFDEQWNRIR